MKLILKDGTTVERPTGLTGLEIAESLAKSLAKEAIAVKIDGEINDLARPVKRDAEISIITKNDPESLEILNHSTAHLMAQAISELYPGAQFAFGPAIEEGFYYDVLFPNPISEDDFPAIEKRMHEISARGEKIERIPLTMEEARILFKDQKYKIDHLQDIEEPITAYKQGEFADLCRGPHVSHTGMIKHFKLLSLAGAYYKGDQANEQLTRIYGTAFFSDQDLENHLKILNERKLCDHRRLGKELGLFMLSDYGPGFPFFLPNGMILRRELENFWYDICEKRGYVFVKTPIILSRELWEISGHWDNYEENMYTTKIDEKDYAIKPMNCPGGMLVYANSIHSYRDLPLRVGELGLVHRHEASGALNGLFRVRSFTQDDAHIFLRPDQLEDEIRDLLKLYDDVYKVFGLSYYIVLSTRPEKKYIGDIETWDRSEAILARCLEKSGIDYKINPGDGAFYGPKLDFKLRDSMNRIWQCGTIQLDANLPERFDLNYIDMDGTKKRPVMLHRAILGSIERFIGIITENFKGAFPTWLSPEQVRVLPVNKAAHGDYSAKVVIALKEAGIRASQDDSDEKLGYRIRASQTQKVPYTLVIGTKEVESTSVTYRLYGREETINMPLTDFAEHVLADIKNKNLIRD